MLYGFLSVVFQIVFGVAMVLFFIGFFGDFILEYWRRDRAS